MSIVTTGNPSIVSSETGGHFEVLVDEQGFIRLTHFGHFGENRLSPLEASELAGELLDGIRKSRDREQIKSGRYYDSKQIEWRANSKLGIATAAVRKIFS